MPRLDIFWEDVVGPEKGRLLSATDWMVGLVHLLDHHAAHISAVADVQLIMTQHVLQIVVEPAHVCI